MKILNLTVLAIIAFAISLTARAIPQEEHWLQYRWAKDDHTVLRHAGNAQAEIVEQARENLVLPEFNSDEAILAKWHTPMLEKGFVWVAVDKKHVNGPYDLLYVDSNNSGNLTEHEPVSAWNIQQHMTWFGPVRLMLEGEDGPNVFHLNFILYASRQREPRLQVSAGGWYEGEITIGNDRHTVTILDRNANATFNDTSLNPWQSDRITIGPDHQEPRFYGKYYELNGDYYRINVARDGAYIEIEPAEDITFGQVEFPKRTTELVLGGENGMFFAETDQTTVQFPAGDYRIYRWQMERQDEQENTWKVIGRSFRDDGNIELTSQSSTILAIGEPIICEVIFSKSGDSYRFRQELKGNYGETIDITVNGDRPEAPKIRITNESGTYNQIYSFEYG